jgi:hypothetical protein
MKNVIGLIVITIISFSCRRANEVSIRFMNSKCKQVIANIVNVDTLVNDSSLVKVDDDNLQKLLPDIEDATQWNVYFLGRRKLGKLRTFTLLLSNGENKSIRFVIIKGRKPMSNFEIAGNGQSEGYSYKSSGYIINDSTVITRKFLLLQTDEPESADANDSIVTEYRLKPDGTFKIISSDTTAVKPAFVSPDDAEYSDEVFYYNGSSPASWAIAGITNPKAFKDFYMIFRNIVKLNDKDQIANYINFPLGSIKDEESFIKNYEKIFTPAVRNAVLSQKIRQLFRDQRGVMIGDNMIWFKEINKEYRIVTLNQK